MSSFDSIRPTLIEAGLSFDGPGYFLNSIDSTSSVYSSVPELDAWLGLEQRIDLLKQGNFSCISEVLQYARTCNDWRLKKVATQVLGHAGTRDCYLEMRSELEGITLETEEVVDPQTREIILLYCKAFYLWGRLDVVPFILDQYLKLRMKGTPEVTLLPLLMRNLLTDTRGSMIAHDPPEENLEDYLNLVLNEYDAVADKLGSDKSFVYRGSVRSVPFLAGALLDIKGQRVAMELVRLRELFEPATGIDCTQTFENGSAKPLTAASIAEQFLESPAVAQFEEDARYFFGHRIPD